MLSSQPTAQTIDNTTPRTYILAKQLESKGDKRRSQWRQQLTHHQTQLDKSHQRMQTYPTPTERRANRFDPVAHPVQFKRSLTSAAAPSVAVSVKGRVERDIMYSTGATRSQRYYYAHPLSGALLPRQEYDSAMLITQQMEGQGRRRRSRREVEAAGGRRDVAQRPRTAGTVGQVGGRGVKQTARMYEEKEAVEYSRSRGSSMNNRITRPHTAQPSSSPASHTASRTSFSTTTVTPPAHSPLPASFDTFDNLDYDSDDSTTNPSTNPTNPYDQLYRTLLSLLLAHRIVSPDGIERLLQRAADVNGHLDRAKVEWVCDAVREEMRVQGERGERERREEERRSAWQEEEEESRVESEEEEEETAEADEEAKEEDVPVTESEWQALAAEPFYKRPPLSDGDDDSGRSLPRPTEQRTDGEQFVKARDVQQKQQVEDERSRDQSESEDESQQEEQAEPVHATAAAEEEQNAAAEVASPADDEWYEDDHESADEQTQPAESAENDSDRYEKEVVRTASGTHTIEEGDEEEEEEDDKYEQEYEEEDKRLSAQEEDENRPTGRPEEKKTMEAADDDEYGDEKYEEDEQYEEEF